MTVNIKHGACANGKIASLYNRWKDIKQRCNNPTRITYARYGGRGIKLCKRWHDYVAFAADILEKIGPPPTRRHQLDRIDNDKGYTPGNMRWATPKQQIRNSRSVRLITIQGKRMSVIEWCEHFNLSVNTFRFRKRKGLSDKAALTTPVDKRYSR
jgi:hypothetical protein